MSIQREIGWGPREILYHEIYKKLKRAKSLAYKWTNLVRLGANAVQIPQDFVFNWDADAIEGLSDNDKISAWVELSANQYNATQATELKKPKYKTGILNGKPVVRFTKAVETFLSVAHDENLVLSSEATEVVVAIPRDVSSKSRFTYKVTNYANGINNGGKGYFTTLAKKDYTTEDFLYKNDTPVISITTFNSAFDVKFNRNGLNYEIIDGTLEANIPTSGLMYIGGFTSEYYEGDIAQIIRYNRILTEVELSNLLAALERKWGISTFNSNPDLLVANNAANYLSIDTYDGADQLIHPSALYVANGWNGYKYWMAVSPFPNQNDDFENPCIYCSNDGENWIVPDGLTNPITPMPASGYNSDPEIILSPDGLTMHCFYREVDGTSEKIYCKTSTDGVNWGSATLVLSGTSTTQFISPAVIWNGSKYRMWVVDSAVLGGVVLRESDSLLSGWSVVSKCVIESIGPVHLEVIFQDGFYHMFSHSSGGKIEYGVSEDGLHYYNANIMSKSASGWDKDNLYRPTAVKVGNTWHMWYSGATGTTWRIGKTILQSV